jgi:two-component system, LytTR family, sensor kinase
VIGDMYIYFVKKKLYRIALISSPILAMHGIAPAYILRQEHTDNFLAVWCLLSCLIFLFWTSNIFLISKIRNTNSFKRYALSYIIVLALAGMNMSIGLAFNVKPPEVDLIFPFIAVTAINTLILIISNSILLQFQKRNAELEIQRLKLANLEAQKQTLMQQLQPHFLFNALSTLKSLISASPNDAEDYTVKLSDFLRYSIQAKNNDVISLEDEMQFTNDYINLQKVRFGSALQVSMNVQNELMHKKVPVYALQTLVENAIKHNAFTEKNPLFIEIKADDSKGKNRIKVENNRLPKTIQIPSGTGLDNLNQRYLLISDIEIEIVKSDSIFAVYIHLL